MDNSPRFKKNPPSRFKKQPGGIRRKIHQNTYKHGKGSPIPRNIKGLAGKLSHIKTQGTPKKRSANPSGLSESQAHKIGQSKWLTPNYQFGNQEQKLHRNSARNQRAATTKETRKARATPN